MPIENIPEIYIKDKQESPNVFIYDFKMTEDLIKTKVNLNMHMFSFLQRGKKQIHFADTAVDVNSSQSLLIKKGNALWTELLDTEDIYYCKLFFFSDKLLQAFMEKGHIREHANPDESPFFVIENDTYITSYINTLSTIAKDPKVYIEDLLAVKFEEIMIYLGSKYGKGFKMYLQSLISSEPSTFKKTIKRHVFSNLKLEEFAFLCNMSLSTFKRHFRDEYGEAPGKWIQNKRLTKAKELLESGTVTPSSIYSDFGYNNLSNFSIAFKNKFGVSPKEVLPNSFQQDSF